MNNFRLALRQVRKSPGFTLIAVLTLSLGIGANSAIFSVVDTVLLRPLPFPQTDQLVAIWGTSVRDTNARETESFPDLFDFRAQSQSFSALAGYCSAGAVLSGVGGAQELSGVAVDGDFFETIGLAPMLGRGFTAEEAKAGAPNVVVLSYALWKRAFASNPGVIGRQITLTSRSCTVLGVMPPGWKFPVEEEASDFVMPLEPLMATSVPQRGSHFLRLTGRLKPGVSVRQADSELKAIAARLAQQFPDTNTDRGASVVPMLQDIVGKVRPALLILLGAVALVLLIACANVANLLLGRAAARTREIGIRAALGASRAGLVRQLLVESLLLALLGAGGGLLLAWWSVDLLGALGPRNVPRLSEIHINLGVAAFTFCLAILSTLIFGLVPALQISHGNLTDALQPGAKGSTGGLRGRRIRAVLVVSQVSLSLLLLAGAGLLMRSFFNLQATNVGFDPTHLLVLDEALPRANYSEEPKQRSFYEQLLSKLTTLPGFESVGGVNPAPFTATDHGSSFRLENEPDPGLGDHPGASHVIVTPKYFHTMHIPLRAGRDFDAHDDENAAHVALVNETFVRRFIPNRDPIGQHILLDHENGASDALAIVGVVGDAKQNEISAPTPPEMYQPFAQSPARRLWLVFRIATENPAGVQSTLRRVFHEQDANVFVSNIEPMQKMIGKTLAQPRFNMVLLGVFAGIAMVLAAIGIYGVIAYSVAQRTREIGIRIALGAAKSSIFRLVVGQAMTLVAISVGVGLLGAFAATRLLHSLLFGVGASDPITFAVIVLLIAAVAFLACWIPAFRASRVDPIIALRYE